jgi:NTP pyrophosphatase (non-canonical NTP hydrolase)
MDLRKFQKTVDEAFGDFDRKSGPFFLMTVLAAEIGEVAEAVKNEEKGVIAMELADSLFTLVSIANVFGIDITKAVEDKYFKGNLKNVSKAWREPYLGKRIEEL